MNKKDVKKIIIPAIAIIVIIGGLVSYFTKPQEVQPVMAPLDTEQDLVEEKEGIPEEPQEDTATDNNEVEIATETEETTDDGINSTHTDIELGEDEYQGDNGNDALQNSYNNLTEDRQAEVDAALQRAKERHPDWFEDDSTNTSDNTGDFEHVGTPSTGQYINPDYNLNEGDYSGLEGGQVY